MKHFLAITATAILGVLGFLADLFGNHAGDLLESLCAGHRRFYACLLLSFAACGFIAWLVPDSFFKYVILAATVVSGVFAGAFWERLSR